MPNDAVFDTPAPAAVTPAPTNPTPQPTPISADPKAIIAAEIAPIKEQMAQMNQFFAKLQEQAEAQLAKPANGGSEDWGSKFYQKPQETVQEEIAAQTLPALQSAASAMGKMLLAEQARQIDSEFGDGTWSEVFAPKLDPIVKQAVKSNPMSLMNSEAVSNAVNIIRGNPENFAKLMERHGTRAAKAAEPDPKMVEAAVNRVVEMTGGIRRVPTGTGPKLDDPESQEILKLFERETGKAPDVGRLSRLVAKTGQPTTYSEWLAATKETK